MGGGSWNSDFMNTVVEDRRSKPQQQVFKNTSACDPLMNPFGVTVRESRDSADHPESNAVLVVLDVTGSNIHVARRFADGGLVKFMSMLQCGLIPHPQVAFWATGDVVKGDRSPLQVGQFESDERIDEWLTRTHLEGGGGGGGEESYDLALYFVDRHTAIDCFEKRGRKGYCFLIADEMAYLKTRASDIADVIGSNPETDVSFVETLRRVRERYHVFNLYPVPTGRRYEEPFWHEHLGREFVLNVDDGESFSEVAATVIGLTEGTIDPLNLAEGLTRLEVGQSRTRIVEKAVQPYVTHLLRQQGGAVSGTVDTSGGPGSERL